MIFRISVLFGLDGTNVKGFGLVFVQDAGLDEVYSIWKSYWGGNMYYAMGIN